MNASFGDDPAADAAFLKADLLPFAMKYRCPSCGRIATEEVELSEDEFGFSSVPVESRFLECECGALIDIGWTGWKWHDGASP